MNKDNETDMRRYEDQQLWDAFREGNEIETQELLRRITKVARIIAYKRGFVFPDVADEMAQDFLLEAIERRGDAKYEYDSARAGLDTWVYWKFRDCVQYYDRIYPKMNPKQTDGQPFDEKAEIIGDEGLNDPAMLNEKKAIIEKIIELANEFSDDKRTMLRLFLEGYSNTEIASHLGKKTNTVTKAMIRMWNDLARGYWLQYGTPDI